MQRDLGPRISLNQIFTDPTETDPHHFDFDEGPSLSASLRRQTLVDRIIRCSHAALRDDSGFTRIKRDLIKQKQFEIGSSYAYSVQGIESDSIFIVQQKLKNPTSYEQRPFEYISIEMPNLSEHPVMSNIPIRGVLSLGRDAENYKLATYGFITDQARDAVAAVCEPEQAWQEWLLQNFTMPHYGTFIKGVGASLVAMAPFSNSELSEIYDLLISVVGEPTDEAYIFAE